MPSVACAVPSLVGHVENRPTIRLAPHSKQDKDGLCKPVGTFCRIKSYHHATYSQFIYIEVLCITIQLFPLILIAYKLEFSKLSMLISMPACRNNCGIFGWFIHTKAAIYASTCHTAHLHLSSV